MSIALCQVVKGCLKSIDGTDNGTGQISRFLTGPNSYKYQITVKCKQYQYQYVSMTFLLINLSIFLVDLHLISVISTFELVISIFYFVKTIFKKPKCHIQNEGKNLKRLLLKLLTYSSRRVAVTQKAIF